MLGNPRHTGNTFKLASYLLSYSIEDDDKHVINNAAVLPNYAQYTNTELRAELLDVLKKLKAYHEPGLSGFQHFRQNVDKLADVREAKALMLEEHHVYDKFILVLLKEFVIITLAFLIKLEKMHKKLILCGNISPYNFMYNRKLKQCEPCDLSVVLSDKAQVHAEEQLHGDMIYVITELGAINYNRYLAPELKESIIVYTLQRRLKNLMYAMETRGLILEQQSEIKKLLLDFHQKKAKYSNKAEIYSVGYSINQILSHMLAKLTYLNLGMNESIPDEVDKDIIIEADLLLPDHFVNHSGERVIDLLNEGVEYVHDLMHEHPEHRDSLPESIEKFRSLLKRITAIQPHFILEHEEPEIEEAEFAVLLEEHEGHDHHAHEAHDDHHGGAHDDHHGGAHDAHGGAHDDHHGGAHDDHHGGAHDDHHDGAHDDHHDGAHDDHHGGAHDDHHGGAHDDHHGGAHDDHHGGAHDAHGGAHDDHKEHHGSAHDDHSIGGFAHNDHEAHDHDDHGHDDHDQHHTDDDHGHHGSHDDHATHGQHAHPQHAAGHDADHAGHDAGHGSHDSHAAGHGTHDAHAGHEGGHKDSHPDKAGSHEDRPDHDAPDLPGGHRTPRPPILHDSHRPSHH